MKRPRLRDKEHGSARRTVVVLGIVAGLALAVSVAITTFGGCGPRGRQNAGAGQAEAAAQVPVVTERVGRGRLEEYAEVTGTVKTLHDVVLGSTTTGTVVYVAGEEGDRIRAGQVAVRLDTSDISANIRQAKAQLEASKVRLSQAQRGRVLTGVQTSTGVEAAGHAVELAEVRLREAQLARELAVKEHSEAVTQAQAAVDQARAHLSQAQSGLDQTKSMVEAAVAQARAVQQQAQARLDRLELGARDQERRQAEQAVHVAELNLDNARTEYGRMQTLHREGAVAQTMVDAARLRYDTAQSQLASAKAALSLVEEGATKEDIEAARQAVLQAQAGVTAAEAGRLQVQQREQDVAVAQQGVITAEANLRRAQANTLRLETADEEVAAAETALRTARTQLEQAQGGTIQVEISEDEIAAARAAVKAAEATLAYYSAEAAKRTIVCPVNGVINKRLVDPGETVMFGGALMQIVSPDTLYFEATVSEQKVGLLNVGDAVRTQVDGVPGVVFEESRILAILAAGDPASRMFTLRISLPADPRIKPGMFARGRIPTAVAEDVVIVSKDAIVDRADKQLVFVVSGGKAQEREVEVGLTYGGKAEVVSGLEAGEEVVVVGHSGLADGAPVRVQSADQGGK